MRKYVTELLIYCGEYESSSTLEGLWRTQRSINMNHFSRDVKPFQEMPSECGCLVSINISDGEQSTAPESPRAEDGRGRARHVM